MDKHGPKVGKDRPEPENKVLAKVLTEGGSCNPSLDVSLETTSTNVKAEITMDQHTPGPWFQNINARYPIYAGEAPNHCYIAGIMGGSGAVPELEREANLRLITAAPDLYAACRELIHGDGTDASLQRAIDLARIALGLEKRDYQASV